MPMSRLYKVVALTALLSLAPYTASACTCISASTREAASRSDQVFLGEVISIHKYKSSDFAMWVKDRVAQLGDLFGKDWRRNYGRDFRQEVTLRVVENFKGKAAKELVITTGWGGGDCGVPFDKNATYLVFARRLGDRSELVTSDCDGTGEVKRRQAELAELRRGI